MVTKKKLSPSADEYLEEIKSLVLAKYRDAEFTIVRRRRNEITVDVATDDDDAWDLTGLQAERATDILIESGIHIVLVPVPRRDNSN